MKMFYKEKKKTPNQIEWHKHAVATAAMHLTGQ